MTPGINIMGTNSMTKPNANKPMAKPSGRRRSLFTAKTYPVKCPLSTHSRHYAFTCYRRLGWRGGEFAQSSDSFHVCNGRKGNDKWLIYTSGHWSPSEKGCGPNAA